MAYTIWPHFLSDLIPTAFPLWLYSSFIPFLLHWFSFCSFKLSGSLHIPGLQCPLPGMILPRSHCSLTFFRSWLKCHTLTEIFLELSIKNYKYTWFWLKLHLIYKIILKKWNFTNNIQFPYLEKGITLHLFIFNIICKVFFIKILLMFLSLLLRYLFLAAGVVAIDKLYSYFLSCYLCYMEKLFVFIYLFYLPNSFKFN